MLCGYAPQAVFVLSSILAQNQISRVDFQEGSHMQLQRLSLFSTNASLHFTCHGHVVMDCNADSVAAQLVDVANMSSAPFAPVDLAASYVVLAAISLGFDACLEAGASEADGDVEGCPPVLPTASLGAAWIQHKFARLFQKWDLLDATPPKFPQSEPWTKSLENHMGLE